MRKCSILAGGEIDYNFISEESIRKSDLIICADSGYLHAKKLNITPHIIVGDFDSYTEKLPENVEIHRSPPEKDDTDTMLAVKTAIERECREILLYGGTGGRLDHTIANIQTMLYARKHGVEMCMDNGRDIVMIQGRGTEYYSDEGTYFSVFALTEELKVNYMRGVKYPVENFTFTNSFPIGVSNEILQDGAELSIASGLALIVFSEK